MMMIPITKKFGVPIFLKKFVKDSIVSIILVSQQRPEGRCRREGGKILLI
jgi:hypothetical protein